jgi:glycosyltransferase involved in cell wall biosynthesis
MTGSPRALIVVSAEWYFWSHRLAIAKALKQAGYDVVVAAAEERGYGKHISAAGIRFIPLALCRRSTGLRQELNSIRALYRLYRDERPAIVHHVAIKPVLYGSIAARFARVPAVLNAVPGLGYMFLGHSAVSGMRRTLATLAYRMALRGRNTHVIFQNPEDLDWFVKKGVVAADRAVLIRGSGVDLDRFHPTPEPAGTPIIILPARLLWDKGVGELVEASRLLRRRGVACRVALVGTPDEENPRAVPQATLRAWNEEGVIEWWGQRDDMPEVLAAATIVVLPSYREGVPKALLEAAASGRAMVTTDVPGCREIVRHERTGLLVPPANAPALADAIERLIRDDELRTRLALAARALAESEFGEPGVVRATLDAYSRLLSQSTEPESAH